MPGGDPRNPSGGRPEDRLQGKSKPFGPRVHLPAGADLLQNPGEKKDGSTWQFRTGEIQKVRHDGAHPLGFPFQDAQNPASNLLGGFTPLEQLHTTADGSEGVPEFVGESGGELPDGGESFTDASALLQRLEIGEVLEEQKLA